MVVLEVVLECYTRKLIGNYASLYKTSRECLELLDMVSNRQLPNGAQD